MSSKLNMISEHFGTRDLMFDFSGRYIKLSSKVMGVFATFMLPVLKTFARKSIRIRISHKFL